MRIVNSKQYGENYFGGYQVELLSGDFAPDGDNTVRQVNFSDAAIGSTYWHKVTDHQVELRVKVKDDNRDDDWVIAQGIVCQRVLASEFTDGGSTTGTLVLDAVIPAGSFFVRYTLTSITDFVGSASVELDLGDGSDADRYNSTTAPSVASTAVQVDPGAPSGTVIHATAVSALTVTVTADDYGNVIAGGGAATITFFYYGNAAA